MLYHFDVIGLQSYQSYRIREIGLRQTYAVHLRLIGIRKVRSGLPTLVN